MADTLHPTTQTSTTRLHHGVNDSNLTDGAFIRHSKTFHLPALDNIERVDGLDYI